ncbi:bifunctional DNA-binding transcriptional regulator/O6-methylguanine-DNA methyltransferase Ada [Massilia sp. YIM B02763]|uniref:bifunctional DNA-binding transcriptional regulator/O6-methylguanine-DNA methyltransferase Ada n=1 Tax=Massilia sp. YIM B02763 TaxID=3050130 RepID=UPI0025B67472|nr:bifunctional DNA-binding transcriptional regulator/O6-methylguanine-DNA methyltransferase Ada [Massilia sp. YIM B02763]MDN4055277.1 bifunctional DNA-binding transcriptional regulator/O6-methylguanine-DNA methyltransferase Ada [Massilia sp. YIM B02763]
MDQPDYASDDARWDAVQRREPAADGRFYYSVRSTGVYCRPSCASRGARRANVAFHASCAEAEAAGFRPCLRCKPDQPPLAQRQAAAVAQACRLIEAAADVADKLPDLDTLARACGMSRFHFHRVFKAHTGITPKAYAAARRAERVRQALAQGAPVTDAFYAAGWQSSAPFYAAAGQQLGMAPGRYRKGGEGETIAYALGACSLGTVLVASTATGICAILIGDDEAALVEDVRGRFPNAALAPASPDFAHTLARVIAFVDAPRAVFDLPLDVRGTVFQQRVWDALRRIPPGETISYTELAARVGQPSAVRAVAGACAANPAAIAIPCHRVLRNDGAISGYRWGVERKRALLDRELEKS